MPAFPSQAERSDRLVCRHNGERFLALSGRGCAQSATGRFDYRQRDHRHKVAGPREAIVVTGAERLYQSLGDLGRNQWSRGARTVMRPWEPGLRASPGRSLQHDRRFRRILRAWSVPTSQAMQVISRHCKTNPAPRHRRPSCRTAQRRPSCRGCRSFKTDRLLSRPDATPWAVVRQSFGARERRGQRWIGERDAGRQCKRSRETSGRPRTSLARGPRRATAVCRSARLPGRKPPANRYPMPSVQIVR